MGTGDRLVFGGSTEFCPRCGAVVDWHFAVDAMDESRIEEFTDHLYEMMVYRYGYHSPDDVCERATEG